MLKQTFLKGCIPRTTWSKNDVLHYSKASLKISTEHPKEQSDIRFVVEVQSANNVANSSNKIKNLVFNTENPNKAVATISNGNMFKDISVTADIKSGNNVMDLFNGIVGFISTSKMQL